MAVIAAPVYPAIRLSRHASWTLLQGPGTAAITVEGDLDLACAGAFVAALAAVGAGGSDAVVDMAGVEFIDSSTLRALAGASRLFENLGRRLTLRAPSRPVRRMLGLCRLNEVIASA